VAADVDVPTSQAKPAETAWDVVYARTRPSLVRALTAATGTYEGVEDAIQDAFGEALRRSPSELANVEGWLFAVALNRLRSHHRRVALLRRLRLASAPQPSELDRALQRADIKRVLDSLTRRERELLVAKHYIGMTQDEIASYMHLPRGTVSAAISRAAARFRELEGER
jgi:RNA polymerase sigma factor (sigma-70 family)